MIKSSFFLLVFYLAQKKQEEKKIVANEKDEEDSDDDDDDNEKSKIFIFLNRFSLYIRKNLLDLSEVNNADQEKINDDLLYDPEEEQEDEKWMVNQRLK